MQEIYFVSALDNSPELVKVIEKHCKVKVFGDAAHGKVSKEMDDLFLPAVKKTADHEELDHAKVYESFKKRIADVPALVSDCCQQYRLFVDVGDVSEITIAQNKAAGRWTQTIAAPAPSAFGGIPPESYLPRFHPFHF